MLKVELHAHTSDDPRDHIQHTATELIDRAAALDYDAIAITLHNMQLDVDAHKDYAAERGLVLIRGVERDVDGKHVLLINFSNRAEQIRSFEELASLRRDEPEGLVIAPHPFYPTGSCLRTLMHRHAELFDAVELNAMYSRSVNFNRAAERWARTHGKPIVGNADVHRLEQLGSTYSLVEAERSAAAICDAIRQGKVSVRSEPLGLFRAARMFLQILPSGLRKRHASPRPAGR